MQERPADTVMMILAALLGLIGVGLGAAGAHALKPMLIERGTTAAFETAVFYQLAHVWVPYVCVWLRHHRQAPIASMAGWVVIGGVVLFSGSLYFRSLWGITIPGAAPTGGLLLILAWGLMLLAPLRRREEA